MANEKQARTQAEANAQVGAAFLVAGVNEITRLETDLAAANATIAAQRLALATMREALEGAKIPHLEVDGDPWFSCCLSRAARDYCLRHDDPKKPCPGYCTCGAADHNARIDAILAQPDDDAAALAGAVLEAADASHAALGALLRHYERHTTHRCEIHTDANDAADDYRRARSALRGHGAVEG